MHPSVIALCVLFILKSLRDGASKPRKMRCERRPSNRSAVAHAHSPRTAARCGWKRSPSWIGNPGSAGGAYLSNRRLPERVPGRLRSYVRRPRHAARVGGRGGGSRGRRGRRSAERRARLTCGGCSCRGVGMRCLAAAGAFMVPILQCGRHAALGSPPLGSAAPRAAAARLRRVAARRSSRYMRRARRRLVPLSAN